MHTISKLLRKNTLFSNFWVRNGISILIIALLASHLTERKNFPLNDSYSFPWFSILVSIFLQIVILVISYFNFKYFKAKYFITKVDSRILLRFLFSTLGYISIIYIIIYVIFIGLLDANYDAFGFLIGYSITLLLSIIGLTIFFAKDVYDLHKMGSIEGKLNVQQGGKITLINYTEISFIYSENKIVYIVKTDGDTIVTDFTLNEIEDKISEQSFFRANRQIILHPRAVEEVSSIENGKLSVVLKPAISGKNTFHINISRYKKQAFMEWFKSKL